MLHTRASGVLMHITSLPSPYGCGVFGQETKDFIQTIKDMGFSYLQVLPLNPPDFFGSPYASPSAFAISTMLIDPAFLENLGLISEEERRSAEYDGSPYTANYAFRAASSDRLLRLAFERRNAFLQAKLEVFRKDNAWVLPYALFMALKEKFDGKPWWAWEDSYAHYESALEQLDTVQNAVDYYTFTQYIAHENWADVKQFANEHGVKILGDMPIYVSRDSADVYGNRQLFQINEKSLNPAQVAGVPPDYFAKDGQLWGNPLYDWDAMEQDGYQFWIDRIQRARALYDTIRIDHFRAFASYWSVPAESKTAKDGVWVEGPRMKLFSALKSALGEVPLVAEDLGVFGEDVVQLLEDTGFPGMRVIQFGFDPNGDSTHLPHNYPRNCVAYVGTHDNQTLLAWLWEASPEERKFALDYCGFTGENWGEGGFKSPACRKIIETVWRSSAALAILSYQDLCGFGSDARMNTPGRADGNWLFRTTEDMLQQIDKDYYTSLNRLFRRG